jgi:hypothetical protein
MRLAVLACTWLAPLMTSAGQTQAGPGPVCPPARDSSRITRDPSIPGVIAGELTDGDSGRLLDDAVVRISPPGTLVRMDSLGRFRTERLQPQRYVVEALRIGYERRVDTITVVEDSGTRMHLALIPAAVDRCMEVRRPPSPQLPHPAPPRRLPNER